MDNAFKKVTEPAGVAVVLQQQRDFSQPFQQPLITNSSKEQELDITW
jgi:hypothetical protein